MNNIENRLRLGLIGKTCRNFHLIETGTLILYFDASPDKVLQNSRLWIDCTWRLRRNKSVLVGSFDASEEILTSLQQLPGKIVTDATVDSITGDLCLSFSTDCVIDTFCYSVADEHWELRQSDGRRIGIGPNLEGYDRIEEPDRKGGKIGN